MILSKNKLTSSILSSLLLLFIITIPSALLFKLSIANQEFSISYLVLILFLSFSISYYLFKIQIFSVILKKDIFLHTLLVFYVLFLSVFKGIDVNFIKFTILFYLAYLTGYKYAHIFTSNYFINKFIKFSIFVALIGIILYYLKIPIFDFKTAGSELYFMNSDGYYRAMSIFLNPNSFGYFLVFSFSLLVAHKFYINKFFYYLYSSIILFSIYLTYSRSAELAIFFILLILFIKFIFNKKYTYYFIILLTFSILVIFSIILFNLELFYFYDIRFEKWNVALIFLQNLDIFLIGKPIDMSIVLNGISFSDNMFFYLILNNGFLYFFIFMFFYLRIVLKSIKYISLNEKNYRFSYALYVIAILFPMIFSNFLLFFPSSILTGISMGIISKQIKYKDNNE